MHILWSVWVNARTREAAQRVYERAHQKLGREIDQLSFEPYPKLNGWTILFQMPIVATTWNDGVVEGIALGQRISNKWILLGDVYHNLTGWSDEPTIAGIVGVEWILEP